ncbi:MAG: AgmX/PglI C-terminal domain-containing protein [Polyangiales bacterium]
MPCSACAHDNPPDARFCGACGEPQKRGLIRPGTVSLALPYPPARIHQTVSFGDETLAGVGITSPKKTWAVLGISSAVLFILGGLAVYVSVTPRGPAGSDAPVLIANVEPTQPDERELPSDLPDELPEGVDLDALVEHAVPSLAPDPVPEPAADPQVEPAEPATAPSRTTTPRATTPQMRATSALPPTYPPTPTPMATTPMTTTPMTTTSMTTTSMTTTPANTSAPSGESPYTAATYGPAARRTVSSRYMGDIERCFGEADGRSPGFSGTILVAYMLTQAGQVASARIARNTTGDTQLGTCLTTAGRRWNLPQPPRRTLEFSMSFAR